MSTEHSVEQLREATSRVLDDVELGQVYMVSNRFDVRSDHSETEFRSAYTVRTRSKQNDEGDVLVWAKYIAFALADDGEGTLPDDAEDLTPALIDELYAWRIETEWVAEFNQLADERSEDNDRSRYSVEDLSAFALVMGPPTIHPYVRELLQSMTGRSQYPAYTIGLLTPISALPNDDVINIFVEGDGDDPVLGRKDVPGG